MTIKISMVIFLYMNLYNPDFILRCFAVRMCGKVNVHENGAQLFKALLATSLLRVFSLTNIADLIHNILRFLPKKCE